MTISVLAPVRDQGRGFGSHVRACLQTVSDLDVEFILIDNQSIDGCCHCMPRDVLIVRTERVESPARLWRLGQSLASGESVLWLPGLASLRPDGFRALILAGREVQTQESAAGSDIGRGQGRFAMSWTTPALLTSRARSRLNRWRHVFAIGRLASGIAACRLRTVVISTAGNPDGPDDAAVGPDRVPTSAPVHRGGTRLSVIITAHNEGDEVLRTVESVRANTHVDHEIIVVDDASTDGSCAGLEAIGVRVIRHPNRVGVAYSRDAGSLAAEGDAFAYLDGHQRVEPGCLDHCAELALGHDAIICPPCRPLKSYDPVGYGASFTLCPERGFFSARTRIDRPRQEISRISALRSPGYVIPRSVYRQVRWIAGLRGWGATDFSVSLKAFFTDVDILRVSTGGTQHLFRKTIPYETSWAGVWRNHALIARVCFDDRTWSRYWLPEVFRANLPDDVLAEMDSPSVLAERDAFMAEKVRPDREFWRGLLHVPEPSALI